MCVLSVAEIKYVCMYIGRRNVPSPQIDEGGRSERDELVRRWYIDGRPLVYHSDHQAPFQHDAFARVRLRRLILV